jgi:hypothetical protein
MMAEPGAGRGVTLRGNRQGEDDDMAADPGDEQRQSPDQNDYAPKTASGAQPGFVLSAWSLALGAVFLVLILGGLMVI